MVPYIVAVNNIIKNAVAGTISMNIFIRTMAGGHYSCGLLFRVLIGDHVRCQIIKTSLGEPMRYITNVSRKIFFEKINITKVNATSAFR